MVGILLRDSGPWPTIADVMHFHTEDPLFLAAGVSLKMAQFVAFDAPHNPH